LVQLAWKDNEKSFGTKELLKSREDAEFSNQNGGGEREEKRQVFFFFWLKRRQLGRIELFWTRKCE